MHTPFCIFVTTNVLGERQPSACRVTNALSFHLAALEEVGKDVKTAVALMREVSSVQRTQEESILKWSTMLNYISEQSPNLERHEQGAGQWLLDSTVF